VKSISVRNPHSVLEALRRRPQDVQEIHLGEDQPKSLWSEVVSLAEQNRIRVSRGSGADSSKKNRVGRTSIYEAMIVPKAPLSLNEILEAGGSESEGVWFAIDCVQDPHNLGAIFRIAGFFDVRGVILPEDRTAPLSGVAYDVSCGGVEGVPFCQETNLARALRQAKENDFWILGTSEKAEMGLSEVKRDRKWIVVLGNEESGIRENTAKNCDLLCKIPASGPIDSLNVSVAAGIVAYSLSSS